MNMDMDVFVSNAEKSYNLLQGIFTKATKAALTSSKAEQPVKNQITKNLKKIPVGQSLLKHLNSIRAYQCLTEKRQSTNL